MSKQQKLKDLKEKMKADDSLPLKKEAANLVFGEGDVNGEIMFIGEGPGYWEDQKARPFVGTAGAFLNQLLQLIEVPREEVFITNVVHYRPPNNRDPLPEELKAFEAYLDEMIKIINPRMIVTLGRFSMAKFIPGVTITSVHGKKREIKWNRMKIIVVPMYHPAAGLRNGEMKRRTIEDFKKLPEILENAKKAETEVEEKKEVKQTKLF